MKTCQSEKLGLLQGFRINEMNNKAKSIQFQSSPTAIKFGHYYDLTKSMEPELTSTSDVTTLQDSELQGSRSVSEFEL